MPETWRGYKFVGWKIDGAWASDNPPTVRMDRPHDVLAIFEINEGNVFDAEEIIIDVIPRVAEITIDNKIYLPDELPVYFTWDPGTEHVIFVEPIVNEGIDTRYVFDMWKDRESERIRTITAGEVTELIALFKTQDYLRIITEYSSVQGGGWYDEGETVDFSLNSEVFPHKDDDGIQYAFDSWDLGDYRHSPKNSIPLQNPTTVTANWKEEYKLDLRSNAPDYFPNGGGFYLKGKSLALLAEEEIRSSNYDVKYVFLKWVSIGPNPVIISNALSPSTTITVDNPFIIEARYKKSYLVNVWSPFGSTSGAGFYDEGDIAEIRVNNKEVITEPGKVKKIFSGWDTGGSRVMDFSSSETNSLVSPPGRFNLMVIVDQPSNITAQWTSQYYLDIRSPEGQVSGAGWYIPGSLVPISVKKPTQPPGMWSTYAFKGWSGDIESNSPTTKIIMNQPRSVVAEWDTDNSPGIVNGIILGGVGVVGFFIYKKIKKNGKFAIGNIGGGKRSDLPFERRSLGCVIGKKESKTSITSQNNKQETLPRKKSSIINWLMGND